MTFNYPQGDDWRLEDKDPQSQYYGRKFHFDFSELNGEEIKDVVKSYVWGNYIAKNMAISGIHKCFVYFKWFNRYAIKSHITTLKDLTNMQICLFMSYLNTVISVITDKKLSYITRKNSLDSVKNIVHWCQIHKPEAVPDSEIFAGNEYTGINQKLRIDFIPDDILLQINNALKTEENPYLKYGIIILESTGMRIGDLLCLEKDCIKPHLISGYTISWFDHKNRKYHKPMPVRFECFEAVEMTAHYLSLQSEEVKNIYADMVLSPDSKIAGLRAKEIKGNLNTLFNGKTEEQISDVIEDLAQTMSFNPLPTGVCLYDFRRGNCTDGDGCFFYNCPNYITEAKFYPILKSELDLMEKEMDRLKFLGREREWQKQFIKHKYLKPLVESLEVQKDET